jgi:hypothetical protein
MSVESAIIRRECVIGHDIPHLQKTIALSIYLARTEDLLLLAPNRKLDVLRTWDNL